MRKMCCFGVVWMAVRGMWWCYHGVRGEATGGEDELGNEVMRHGERNGGVGGGGGGRNEASMRRGGAKDRMGNGMMEGWSEGEHEKTGKG